MRASEVQKPIVGDSGPQVRGGRLMSAARDDLGKLGVQQLADMGVRGHEGTFVPTRAVVHLRHACSSVSGTSDGQCYLRLFLDRLSSSAKRSRWHSSAE